MLADVPMYAIASSAGFEGSTVVEELLKHDNPDQGFDRTRGLSPNKENEKYKMITCSFLVLRIR